MTEAQVDAVEDLIIAASGGGPDRLSYLELLAGQFAEGLGQVLTDYLRADVVAELDGMTYRPGAELHGEHGDKTIRLVAEFPPWPGNVALLIDRRLMLTMLNALLGLRTAPDDSDDRQFTRLETRILRQIAETILGNLATHLSAIRPISARNVAIEEAGEDAPAWALAERCFSLKANVTLLECEGTLTIVLPEDNMADDRDLVAVMPEPDQGPDCAWRTELSELLSQADVTLTAVLAETQISLSDAMGWAPGRTVAVGIDTSRELNVYCDGRTAFRAVAGHRDSGAIALQLTTEVEIER